MKAPTTGTNRRKTNNHDEDYWDKLQKQFKGCRYDHIGAYAEIMPKKSKQMRDLQRRIDTNEQILHGDTFIQMKANSQFRVRTSDRLLVAGQLFDRARA